MWIYCKAGFVSAVELRGAPECLLLRGRIKEDMFRVAQALGLSTDAVELNPTSDYAWRLGHNKEVTKKAFATLMAEQIENIGYDSHVKEQLSKPDGTTEEDRYSWYLSSWTAGLKVQNARLGKGASAGESMMPLDDELSSFGRVKSRPRSGGRPWGRQSSLAGLVGQLEYGTATLDSPSSRFGPDIPDMDDATANAYEKWCRDYDADPDDLDSFEDFIDEEGRR